MDVYGNLVIELFESDVNIRSKQALGVPMVWKDPLLWLFYQDAMRYILNGWGSEGIHHF